MALFRSDSAPWDSLARRMSPRFGNCTWRFCEYNRTKSPDRPRHMAILSGKVEQQQLAWKKNQSSSTWKHNRTISKTIDCITGALHTSVHMTWKQTKYSGMLHIQYRFSDLLLHCSVAFSKMDDVQTSWGFWRSESCLQSLIVIASLQPQKTWGHAGGGPEVDKQGLITTCQNTLHVFHLTCTPPPPPPPLHTHTTHSHEGTQISYPLPNS